MVPGDVTTLALAYAADLAIGDPPAMPHPIRGMGAAIAWGERILRAVMPWERAAGVVLVSAVVGGSTVATSWLLKFCSAQSPWAGLAMAATLLFTCLSIRDLARESWKVFSALEAGDVPLARRRVARIVGRDTQQLDRAEIVRAALETIAESTLDGILAPLFWFVIGGVPGAVAYKAINTLDSMVGHRSARYIRFGWAAAKLDTLANWLPARWSAPVFTLAAWWCRFRVRDSWRAAWVQPDGTVPNAGIPEGALAGALGVRLGGTNWYQGQPVTMPFLGAPNQPLEPARIRDAIRLMYAASFVGWGMALGAVALKSLWFASLG
ncbi:MAG TPA: cobalamin biosynthesis protein CobD [Candidatus Omnitrophica bacterium]|nr:MAG: cobalamin biosynthesis protein CobD [Omnitrophica WOR_2 bacterium GWA2_63_20]OGX17755.1 MAG: cobalamin biosynthesis protein CobD [Omnitrophica WOR_2 bacterium GWF2_63_9]OGX30936.1 MAG: cobalamin biosynthesis protein CobD [Omnitrophica WOR_2 bacterium RIFCSPHIGHO2_12_FULL_64_13]OGX35059.1 MAG: cobalamin biosynthesis protein CobD [Omnitrophica WOR_2 bacterium RIFCSPHIGHO2_02_FULL_63_39]OGX45658.1 MAG: cobalamin biosynthesis protein CobD [Omnitrophica WOR_2 bacterium RIFCSPLOWO2_02_FULL_63